MLVLLAFFTGLLAAVELIPHVESPMLELMRAPDGCSAPCWQGIRPGVTSYAGAIDLLDANPRIVRVESRRRYNGDELGTWYIHWLWRDSAGADVSGNLMVEDGIVHMIRIESRIPFGLLWETLGQPDQGSYVGTLKISGDKATTFPLYHTAIYPRSGITIQTGASCGDFWRQPSMLTFSATTEAGREYDVSRYRRYSCRGWAT